MGTIVARRRAVDLAALPPYSVFCRRSGRVVAGVADPTSMEFTPEARQALVYARELRGLFERERRKSSRLAALLKTGAALGSIAELEPLLEAILAEAVRFSSHDTGSVMLLSPLGDRLTVRAAVGPSAAYIGRTQRATAGVAGLALRERRPVRLNGRGALPKAQRSYSKAIGSALSLPLLTPDGRALGVLNLNASKQAVELDDDDIEILQAMATQAAVAIENALLHDRLRRSLEELLTLYRAGQAMSSSLATSEILQTVVQTAHGALRAEAAQVLRVKDDEMVVESTAGRVPEGLARGAWREATRDSQAVRHAGSTSRAMLPGGIAVASASLRRGELPSRVLGVIRLRGESFAEDEVSLLATLAAQAAVALENAQLYETLRERDRRLESLVQQLIKAQEEERRQVAIDLHDGLAQQLVAAYQHLQAYEKLREDGSPRAAERWRRGIELLEGSIQESRRVIGQLRPTVLDDLGLVAAVQRLVEEYGIESGWETEFINDFGVVRLPPRFEVTLFRIAQEALNNARKHAATRRVRVRLGRDDGYAVVVVRDWGRGFDPARALDQAEHIGLGSMRERAALLGGECVIESEPGAGTLVEARIPLPAEEEDGEPD